MVAKKELSILERVEVRRLQVVKLRRQGKTVCQMSEILECSKRTISNDIRANRAAMMERAAAMRKEGGDLMLMDGLETYEDVKALHYGIMERAGEKYKEEEISRRQYLGEVKLASELILSAQTKKDILLAKVGVYEGDKASVTVNILAMPEDDAYSAVEKALANPEFAQALCNLLDARGYQPDIEGEYKELEDKDDDKKR